MERKGWSATRNQPIRPVEVQKDVRVFGRNAPVRRKYRLGTALLVMGTVLATLAAPSSAMKGHVEVAVPVGFFYGTFDESPNIQMVVGGPAEAFCDDYPDNPFFGQPGSTTARIFEMKDGAVDFRIFDKDQPIYLYESDIAETGDAPVWIATLCDEYFSSGAITEPLASGNGILKVHDQVDANGNVDVFNGVNGWAYGEDGTRYKVTASADFDVVNGELVGDPADFVSFEMKVLPPRPGGH